MAKKSHTPETVEAVGVQTLTIQGISFEAPAPYAEGHVVSAAEAAALNTTMGENLRNNFSGHVRKAKEEHGAELPEHIVHELKSKFAEYAAAYSFQAKRQGAAPVDPVAREARKIARAKVDEVLRAKGIAKSSLPEGQMDKYIEAVLAKYPEITDEARRRVEKTKEIASETLDSLFDDAA